MKSFYFILTITIFFTACKKPIGSVGGNAYWTYNKYVGTKPDAGSDIYLFSEDTSKPVLKTQCDVQGNFQFEKVETGKYYLVAESKNTNAAKSDIYYEIKNSTSNSFLGFSLFDLDSNLYKKAFDAYFTKMKYDIDPSPALSAEEKIKYYQTAISSISTADSLSEILIKKIPQSSKFLSTLGFVGFRKIKVFEIEVKKDEKKVQVIDFGITNM